MQSIQVGRGLAPNWPEEFSYLSLSIDDVEQADIVGIFCKAFPYIDEAITAGNDGSWVSGRCLF